jgi:hypothetical protein
MTLEGPTAEQLKRMREEIQDDPEMIKQDLVHLRDWLYKQPHLPHHIGELLCRQCRMPLHSFLPSAPAAGVSSVELRVPVALSRTPFIGAWVGPRTSLELLEVGKVSCPMLRIEPCIVQPVGYSLY